MNRHNFESEGFYYDPELDEFEDVEVESPTNEQLFSDRRFTGFIKDAMIETKHSGYEHFFHASISTDESELVVNQVMRGGQKNVPSHMPAVDKGSSHPEGTGFHLPEDHHPYFEFHTHPGSIAWPSYSDIYVSYEFARQNYNLSSSENGYWINPIAAVGSYTEDQVNFFQFEPELVESLDWDQLESRLAREFIRYGREINVKDINDFDKDEIVDFLIFGELINDEPVVDWPGFARNRDGLARVFKRVGIRYHELDVDKDGLGRERFLQATEDFVVAQAYIN